MLKDFDFWSSTIMPGRAPIKSVITSFISKLFKAIEDCFASLTTDGVGSSSPNASVRFLDLEKKPATIKSVQFLEMLNKILPDDMAKLRKVTFEKTLPKVVTLSK